MDTPAKIAAGLTLAGLGIWGVSSAFPAETPIETNPASSFSSESPVREAPATSKTLKSDTSYSTTRSPSTGDRDCGDFSTQRAAQAFFNSEGSGDPHGLDRDGDGRVCETLP